MTLAETAIGLDTLAGGGVTGMLLAVMVAFLRRTKDTDERRDEASKLIMEAAMEERTRALKERDDARAETAALRSQFDKERQRWEESRGWTTKTHEMQLEQLRSRLRDLGEDPT